jgi:hypothetical protein
VTRSAHLFLLAGCAVLASCGEGRALPDDPAPRTVRGPEEYPPTYDQALRGWRRVEDINAWIADRFTYDGERALELSETRRSRPDASKAPVQEPASFYRDAKGVCVDLARFAHDR